MTSKTKFVASHPFMRMGLVVGLCCLGCTEKIYDLDRQTTAAPGPGWIDNIVMDSDRLYWLEEYHGVPGSTPFGDSGHLLLGCEKGNCSATRKQHADLRAESMFIEPLLAVRNGTFYYTTDPDYTEGRTTVSRETIWRLRPEQGEPVQLFQFPSMSHCTAIAVDDNELFHVDDLGVILALSLASDPFPRVVTTGQNTQIYQTHFLAHGNYLYWGSMGAGISRVSKDGTLPVEILAPNASARSLAIDDNYVYWTDTEAKALLRCVAADCTGTTRSLSSVTVAPGDEVNPLVEPHSLQVRDTSLYWLEGSEGSMSQLYRCSIDGCPNGPELVTSTTIDHYAVDETSIYASVLADALTADGSATSEIRVFPR